MNRMSAPSDVDYYNAVCGLSKAEEDLRLEREEEALREQRWAAFVAIIRPLVRSHGVGYVLNRIDVSHGWSERNRSDGVICDFAAEEGWPNVLRAIARAMEEEAQYRKELVDRR